MTEKSSAASGAPSDSEALTDETLAALELGFENLLIELDPTLYSPKARSVPTPQKADAPGPSGRAVRGCELVYPTGHNIYNRTTDAPVKMMSLQLPGDPRKAQGPPAAGPGTTMVGQTALMRFGTGGVHAFVVCDPGTHQVLRAHPLLAQTLHAEPHVSAFAFRLADVPGRGRGLVASRRIKQDEFVLGEPPLLITPIVPGMTPDVVRAFEHAAEHDMHPRARKALDALYDCHADSDDQQPGGARLRKVRTNNVELWFPMAQANQKLGGTFELISRVNHSCAANLEFHWSIIDFQGSITATKDIQPGEELTMNYLSTDTQKASRATRRAELLKKYRFKCTCPKCGPL